MLSGIRAIGIVGLGLIGGSLALALRKGGFPGRLLGTVETSIQASKALKRGLVDAADTDPRTAAQADLVILATPPAVMEAVMQAILPALPPETVVSDVASVKGPVVAAGNRILGPRFVGAHPVAGSEGQGAAAARSDLFRGSRCVLTPLSDTRPAAVQLVRGLWEAVGCEIVQMAPEDHDRLLALTSHLPHLAAFVLMAQLGMEEDLEQVTLLGGGGLRDFSRIAASDPALWADIALQNGPAILAGLERYGAMLETLRQRLAARDKDGLTEIFRAGQSARARFRFPPAATTPEQTGNP